MALPVTGDMALPLALLFGALFGFLLERGRVTSYDVIVRQFMFRDFTVLKVMLTAILVGGVGVSVLVASGLAGFHIKEANLLGVGLGAALFGIGMVIYGYCPGTALAATATGSAHAGIGVVGMLLGGIAYALSEDWLKVHILGVAAWGKVRLPDVTGLAAPWWFLGLALIASVLFLTIERRTARG